VNLFDRVKRALAPELYLNGAAGIDVEKSRMSEDTYATNGRIGASNGVKAWSFKEPRTNATIMRRLARHCVPVRTAINRRKRQIGTAAAAGKWRLVRRDNPKAKPDARVEEAVKALFDTVNPKCESFRSLLDQVIEDVLVLDAGCIEKEKTLGGGIFALYGVDGASIAPDPNWDGTSPRAIRYRQYVDGRCVAQFRNDQLVYMMANPSTDRCIGFSPVEALYHTIMAELYGSEYEYDQLRQIAPNKALYLGPGVTDQQREKFIEYWENEIAGQKAIAVLSGGDRDGKGEPKVLDLSSDTLDMRLAFYKYLCTRIAALFEMDLLVFNLSETVHKSVGNALTARTDEGANALASLLSEFITREIIWEIDPTRIHAFEFDDLNARDELAQAKIDQIYMNIGKTFPNELRMRDGEDPVPWGDEPYSASQSQFAGDAPADGDQPNDSSQNPDESSEQQGAAKSTVPFAATARRMRTAALSYLGGSSASARVKRNA
jgi:hypothetical protein